MCFVRISAQTAIISLYSINCLDLITETECVYCAVRAEILNIIQFKFHVQIDKCAICTIYNIPPKWTSLYSFSFLYAYRIFSSFKMLKRYFSPVFNKHFHYITNAQQELRHLNSKGRTIYGNILTFIFLVTS
jgi:hypothetical protein